MTFAGRTPIEPETYSEARALTGSSRYDTTFGTPFLVQNEVQNESNSDSEKDLDSGDSENWME